MTTILGLHLLNQVEVNMLLEGNQNMAIMLLALNV